MVAFQHGRVECFVFGSNAVENRQQSSSGEDRFQTFILGFKTFNFDLKIHARQDFTTEI